MVGAGCSWTGRGCGCFWWGGYWVLRQARMAVIMRSSGNQSKMSNSFFIVISSSRSEIV
jgi:hypothetical protein